VIDETDQVWWRIRATRSAPPTAATARRDRRRTYLAALEQAEQLMRAADSVRPASSPLLLFYGLSQAGRAIAAAASDLTADAWRLDGHGIHISPATALAGPDLPGITMTTDPPGARGSFVRLSELLDSPLWPRSQSSDSVRLDSLWDCIPDCVDLPLNGDTRERRTPLYIDHRDPDPDPSALVPTPVCGLPGWVAKADDGHAALAEYLTAFELPDRAEIPYRLSSADGPPDFTIDIDGWAEVTMNWSMPDGHKAGVAEKSAFLESFTRPYQRARYLFPALTPQRQTIHPLMAWWGVMFTLSMLARYQPDRWGTYIDVDSSPQAVALEKVLALARTAVPMLVLETLQEVQ
jgi:hypothetical protein